MASLERSSKVTRSTEGIIKVNLYCIEFSFYIALTIIIRRVFISRTRIFDKSKVRQHFSSLSIIHDPSSGQQNHLGNHGQDLISGRLKCDDDNSASGCPLSQIFHQEEGVKDVHSSGGLVEHDDVGVQGQLTSHVESLALRDGQVFHAGVFHLGQAKVFD